MKTKPQKSFDEATKTATDWAIDMMTHKHGMNELRETIKTEYPNVDVKIVEKQLRRYFTTNPWKGAFIE
jgi:hypothetical protein